MARKFSLSHLALSTVWVAFWLCLTALGPAAGAQTHQTPEKIIAIGDLHGDYQAYIDLLGEAGLIDKKKRWIGGSAVFVQTGDIADRGPDTLKIIKHLKQLKPQAEAAGGAVITLVGNHEAMNMTRDLRYVHPGEYKAFKTSRSKAVRDATYNANRELIEAQFRNAEPGLSDKDIRKAWMDAMPLGRLEHQLAWRPEGEIGSWVLNNPVLAILGDTLFVHGGLSAEYRHRSIDWINEKSREALESQAELETAIINDPEGPLWYRGLIPGKDPIPSSGEIDAEAAFERVLRNHKVKHVVIGHTPSMSGIKSHYDNRLFQIDTGIADHYGGTESFLRIENGQVFAHDNGVITHFESKE